MNTYIVKKDRKMKRSNTTIRYESGIGFGAALAMAISFSVHKSILWAILHGIFGWFYVIYYAFTRG
jgi:p-aminobenzoyl-glutamate transporter AbgT